MRAMLRPLGVLFLMLTIVTGLIYPMAVTTIGRLAFSHEVSGSLLMRDNQAVGSSLIGQSFQDPKYFWGRLSATAPMPNNAGASGGSNLSPTNPVLLEAVRARIAALKTIDSGNSLPVPVDLVTASGSGLDPHVSPAAVLYQVNRVAHARNLDLVKLREWILSRVEGPQWGVFGEARVNVIMLNLALDRAK
jgi:K+-transporting ATPase ATPase C chain